MLNEIIEILVEHRVNGEGTEMSRNGVLSAAKKYGRSARTIDPALTHGVREGILTCAAGRRNAHMYSLANPCSVCSRPITGLSRGIHPACEPTDE